MDIINKNKYMSWKKTIKEVNVGDKVENHRNGKGMVIAKTSRTITVLFENGTKIKNTYKFSDDYFWETDF